MSIRFLNHQYKLTIAATGPGTVIFGDIGSATEDTEVVIISELQITGNIKMDKSSEGNNLSITIYNLSQSSIDKISQEDTFLLLEVGYPGEDLKELFRGGLTSMSTKNPGTGNMTTIKASDSYAQFRDAQTDRTWDQSPVIAEDIVKDIIQIDMGLALGDIHNNTGVGPITEVATGKGLNQPFYTYTATGPSFKVMDDLCDGLELEWNVVNGQVDVYPKGSGRRVKPLIPVFSPETGLVETPSKILINADRAKGSADKKTGKKFKVILSPTLRPGDSIKIKSKNYDEEVSIKSIDHEFNFYKGVWFSNIVTEDIK